METQLRLVAGKLPRMHERMGERERGGTDSLPPATGGKQPSSLRCESRGEEGGRPRLKVHSGSPSGKLPVHRRWDGQCLSFGLINRVDFLCGVFLVYASTGWDRFHEGRALLRCVECRGGVLEAGTHPVRGARWGLVPFPDVRSRHRRGHPSSRTRCVHGSSSP